MLSITQFRSNSMAQANQQPAEHSPHGSAISMLDTFDPEDLLNLEMSLDLLSINEATAKEPAIKELFKLYSNLNFANHPARSVLHLLKNHAFKILARFCHAVAESKDPHLLHLLVQFLNYNISSYAKMEQNYLDWEKKQFDYEMKYKRLKQDL